MAGAAKVDTHEKVRKKNDNNGIKLEFRIIILSFLYLFLSKRRIVTVFAQFSTTEPV